MRPVAKRSKRQLSHLSWTLDLSLLTVKAGDYTLEDFSTKGIHYQDVYEGWKDGEMGLMITSVHSLVSTHLKILPIFFISLGV